MANQQGKNCVVRTRALLASRIVTTLAIHKQFSSILNIMDIIDRVLVIW